jgi:hypothetical protein
VKASAREILEVLDQCCEHHRFPMLDNGYFYLAASRLSLFRSSTDWAMVIEIFGYSPRAGIPDTHVYTLGSRVQRMRGETDFVSRAAFENYLANNPHNESSFIYPIEEGAWQDDSSVELLARGQREVVVRGLSGPTPPREAYAQHGIALTSPDDVQVFEFCRWLAATARDRVLATAEERRNCVPSELALILQLDEWRHPDVVNDELPSAVPTFQALAEILAGGSEVGLNAIRERPNTHWSNWPDAGTL